MQVCDRMWKCISCIKAQYFEQCVQIQGRVTMVPGPVEQRYLVSLKM